MQGVTAMVPGEVVSPSALSATPLAALPKAYISRGFEKSKSSFFSGQAVHVQGSVASSASASHSKDLGKPATVQVKATVWSTIENLFGDKTAADPNTITYKGMAGISKKRGSIGTLVKFDLVDAQAAIEDKAAEIIGKQIDLQLISVDVDAKKALKLSPIASIEGWLTNKGDLDLVADEDFYAISFTVPKDFGTPGAFIVTNNHPHEFFMQNLKLKGSDGSTLEFATNAWIYPTSDYPKDRVFFTNKTYLPSATPAGLQALRARELEQYRGTGTGVRKAADRIYDYDVYNDLGNPDKDKALARVVLGGGSEFPYPRRTRTGRAKTKTDPKSESLPSNALVLPYIPSDEFFLRSKNSTFVAGFIKSVVHAVVPNVESTLSGNKSFSSLKGVYDLYTDGLPIPLKEPEFVSSANTPDPAAQAGNLVYLSTIFAAKGEDTSVLNYPVPMVVHADQVSWMKDEEFGREAVAGLNSGIISRVTSYPPKSALDSKVYGEGTALTDAHILPYLEGLTVAQAIDQKKLFTVDYHDAFLPWMNKVNADTSFGYKGYAPRTIFFYNKAGLLKPVAIELSLPPAQSGGEAINRVFTPADAADRTWDLAKTHASSMDDNYHEVLSHFTYCHGVMEPFIIAAYRQLSELHPIKTLLKPYFKDTLSINAAARDALINAKGIVEANFTMGQYTFQLAAKAYGSLWNFNNQAITESLLSRGMAEPADDSNSGSVKLVLEDYPWAKDGLDIWDAINKWVAKYVNIVYKGSDDAVKNDSELQAWWNEVVNVGHGDLKDAKWWPKMDSTKNLVQIITTIGWIAGPTHASLNFNQYGYAGYPPNKPSNTRRLIPEKGSAEYKELQSNPEKFLMSMIPTTAQATQVMTIIEVLSTHSVDEEYIGTRNSSNWTSDPEVQKAFLEFAARIVAIEAKIKVRNLDPSLPNRRGPVAVPYQSFVPSSTSGITGRGVPNSVSI